MAQAFLPVFLVVSSARAQSSDYDVQKTRAAVLIEKHEFEEALKLATVLNHQVPDDIAGWGLLADANIGLGNYQEAEKDVQWMLDLRQGNVPGFIKAAALRELSGDIDGANDYLDEALRRTPQTNVDQQSWLLAEKARLNPARANEWLDRALQLKPDSPHVLEVLADFRISEKKYDEATALLYRVPKNASVLYKLAEALEKAGRKDQAEATFREFEASATSEPELVFYYADHRTKPAQALAVAERQIAARHDVRTLDAYAWALYKNRKYTEAKTQIDKVLAVGIREPRYFCHAATIASATGGASTLRNRARQQAADDASTLRNRARQQAADGASSLRNRARQQAAGATCPPQ